MSHAIEKPIRFKPWVMLSTIIVMVMVFLAACGSSGSTSTGETNSSNSGDSTANTAKPSQDEPIVFAGLDWDSATIHNAIARHIIEEGYGYKTDAIPGSTIPMLQGMIKGDVDVTMEIWYENVKEAMDKATQDGDVVDLGNNFPDAIQGFWVPTYVIKGDPERGIKPMAPDLKSVTDLPKYKDLFKDPEDPSKGRFYDCIAGWSCEKVNAQKFKAYGLEATYNRFLPGTGAALAASITGAYEKGEPWVGYYWGPTWILGKYDMTQLEEPEYSEACWDSDKKCGYPVVEVGIAVHKDFHKNYPELVEFLTKYETSGDLTSQLLAHMQEQKVEASEAAVHFLKTQPDVWTKWVPSDIAAKVKDSL